MGVDVIQNPAHIDFIIRKNPYSTMPKVILDFYMPGLFQLLPTTIYQGLRNTGV
jgi:hypothetical protein